MASPFSVMNQVADNLDTLLEYYPEELSGNKTVRGFLDNYVAKVKNMLRVNPSFVLLYGDLEDRVAIVLKAIAMSFPPKDPKVPDGERDVPGEIRNFMLSTVKLLEAKKISPFECKRPIGRGEERFGGKVTFSELAGLRTEKEEIMINYIQPILYPSLFVKPPSGILFYGPPGVGKTMLAKAATNELSETAFYYATASELKEKYVGESEKKIDQLFECMRMILDSKPDKYKRAVLFLDEVESLASRRMVGSDAGSAATTSQLIQNMDGLSSDKRISVIAATNLPMNLDKAFLRRIGTYLFVDFPDYLARVSLILQHMAEHYSLPWEADKRVVMRSGSSEDLSDVSIRSFSVAAARSLANIETLGGDPKVEEAAGEGGTTVERTLAHVTFEDVLKLARITGPKDTQGVKDVMKRSRSDAAEFSSDAESTYGYSASDIEKLLARASTRAASRSLDPMASFGFAMMTSPLPDKVDYFRSVLDQRTLGREEATPLKTLARRDIEERQGIVDQLRKAVTEEDRASLMGQIRDLRTRTGNLLNFCLTWEDLRDALDSSRPAVNDELYEELVRWTPSS